MKKSISIFLFVWYLFIFSSPVIGSDIPYNKKTQQIKDKTTAQDTSSFVSLFNGKNTNGWHTFNKDKADPCWTVTNGALTLNPQYEGGGGGALISNRSYKNFILTLQWKISKGGNSGIFINVIENPKYAKAYLTAPEMQVLDNKDAKDNKDSTHLAGSLYDMIACNSKFVHPAGEWNHVKIKQKDGEVTFWINAHQVAHIQIGSQKWENRIANSKFRNWDAFGKSKEGYIGLQDHGHQVWYKDIKIREL